MSTVSIPSPGHDASKYTGWAEQTVIGNPPTLRLNTDAGRRIGAALEGLQTGRTYKITLRAIAYPATTGATVQAIVDGQQRELGASWREVVWTVSVSRPISLEIAGITSVIIHYLNITTEQADVTAVAGLDAGTVAVSITGPARVLSITRADDNGTRPVRLPSGALPANAPLVITDYEAALSGQAQYRVKTELEEISAWMSLGRPGLEQAPRFILPANPLYSVGVETVTDYSAARASSSTIHEIIGRPDPVLALGQLRPRTGRLEVFTRTYQEARDLEALFERGQVAMYRQVENPGQDMYLVATELNTTPTDEALAWLTAITYQEVPFPVGPVLSRPDWTFEALAAEYATFEDVATKFANFNQLTIGEESKQ